MTRSILLLVFTAMCAQSAGGASREQLLAIGKEQLKFAVYSPQPQYPQEAQARRISGSGVFVIRVRVKTGHVVSASAAQSTGSALLDSAAIRTLSKWRFKPGALTPIGLIAPEHHVPFGKEDALLKVPITFAL